MAETHYLTLQKDGIRTIVGDPYSFFRMKITASDPAGPEPLFDENVFVFKRAPASPYFDDNIDEFQAIVSVGDLGEIPIGEPNVEQRYPWFRLPSVTLDFYSQEEAERTFRAIKADILGLLTALNRFQTLEPLETLQLPSTYTPTGQSQSQSESA